MKPFKNKKDIQYRGYRIKREKSFLYVYDERDQCIAKIENINHGSFTEAKYTIDRLIKILR